MQEKKEEKKERCKERKRKKERTEYIAKFLLLKTFKNKILAFKKLLKTEVTSEEATGRCH